MKKSVKEQLEKHAVTPYPRKGWQSEFVVPVSVAMRIIRRACKEAYEKGVVHGLDAAYRLEDQADENQSDSCQTASSNEREDRDRIRQAISDIINGPKKGKRK